MQALLQRGEEMDAMLTEKEKRLEEKEAYIVHLQTGLSGEKLGPPAPEPQVCRSFWNFLIIKDSFMKEMFEELQDIHEFN